MCSNKDLRHIYRHTYHISEVVHSVEEILNELPVEIRGHSGHRHEDRTSGACRLLREGFHIVFKSDVLLLEVVTSEGLVGGGGLGDVVVVGSVIKMLRAYIFLAVGEDH
jgi:hypothetical protein